MLHSKKVFQHLLTHFVKKNAVIVDLTYGDGISWQGFSNLWGYTIIKVDKRKTESDVIQQDLKDFLKQSKNESFDAIFFDPPHYFSDKVSRLNTEGRDLSDVEEVYCAEKEFEEMIECVGKEAHRVLRNNGILIIKMIDGYVGKKYYPNIFKTFNSIVKLEPLGCFVCVLNRKSGAPNLVQINHIYFLVFEKKNK
jgi:DNA modification methylase